MSSVSSVTGNDGAASERWRKFIFPLVFIAALIIIALVFNLITDGRFIRASTLSIIAKNSVYPTFIAWGLCFLFACGYTDMSIGGVVVLGSFASCVFGNWYGYPGVILGGLIVGTLLIFVNFNLFAFTKIPSWIAGLSLAMVYEAIGVFLKVGKITKPLVTVALNEEYRILGQLPWSLLFMLGGLIVVYFVYNRTSIGLNIRAIGGNADVARKLGINVTVSLLKVGLIVGLLVGVASFLQESIAGITTVKTGLTSMSLIFYPLAVFLLASVLQKKINIIIAVPICAFVVYAIFNVLALLGVPSGTLQEACLGAFLIVFGILGQRGFKGVVK
jgi:ribose transport system permease protein